MSTTKVETITATEYTQLRRHDYAGPLSDRLPQTQTEWGALGATHWVMRSTDRGGVSLGPAIVTGRAS